MGRENRENKRPRAVPLGLLGLALIQIFLYNNCGFQPVDPKVAGITGEGLSSVSPGGANPAPTNGNGSSSPANGNGTTTTPPSNSPFAIVAGTTLVSELGKVSAKVSYSGDPTGQQVSVLLYANAQQNLGGEYLGSVSTTLQEFAAGKQFAFTNFDLPIKFKDRVPHVLHSYALVSGQTFYLGASPSFIAYAPTTNGQNYFNTTLNAKLTTSCSSCHSFSYQQAFGLLVRDGALASQNRLLNKALNVGTEKHGGGTRCSSGTSPCLEIKSWAQAEGLN